MKEKDQYFEANLDKLEQLDQLRYELIENKDYVSKLEERLVQVYNDKPDKLKAILKAVNGFNK